MKILQINSVCGFGSTGRIVVDLYSVIEKHGYDPIIAYGRGKGNENINTIKIGNNMDNYVHVFESRLFDKHGLSSIRATKKFIKTIEEVNPDIIHLHNIHGYYLNIEIFFNFLSKFNKPIVWTMHDCWALTGHCAHFDYVKCEKWKSQCEKCILKTGYPKSVLLDNSKKNYLIKKEVFTQVKNMIIITPSIWLKNIVEQSYLKKYPVRVINNGIDLDVFKPRESNFRKQHNIENKKIVLGVANMWGDRKGIDTFIKLSYMLDDNFKIVMVGVDEKQKQQLPENIIGINRTNSVYELAEIYSTADVFVNPTLEDNFPTTNLEALACGTPVITYNTGGSVESINEDVGMIIEKGDTEELYKIIKRLGEKELWSRESCREKAQEYDKTDRYKEYIDIYKDIRS